MEREERRDKSIVVRGRGDRNHQMDLQRRSQLYPPATHSICSGKHYEPGCPHCRHHFARLHESLALALALAWALAGPLLGSSIGSSLGHRWIPHSVPRWVARSLGLLAGLLASMNPCCGVHDTWPWPHDKRKHFPPPLLATPCAQ